MICWPIIENVMPIPVFRFWPVLTGIRVMRRIPIGRKELEPFPSNSIPFQPVGIRKEVPSGDIVDGIRVFGTTDWWRHYYYYWHLEIHLPVTIRGSWWRPRKAGTMMIYWYNDLRCSYRYHGRAGGVIPDYRPDTDVVFHCCYFHYDSIFLRALQPMPSDYSIDYYIGRKGDSIPFIPGILLTGGDLVAYWQYSEEEIYDIHFCWPIPDWPDDSEEIHYLIWLPPYNCSKSDSGIPEKNKTDIRLPHSDYSMMVIVSISFYSQLGDGILLPISEIYCYWRAEGDTIPIDDYYWKSDILKLTIIRFPLFIHCYSIDVPDTVTFIHDTNFWHWWRITGIDLLLQLPFYHWTWLSSRPAIRKMISGDVFWPGMRPFGDLQLTIIRWLPSDLIPFPEEADD